MDNKDNLSSEGNQKIRLSNLSSEVGGKCF